MTQNNRTCNSKQMTTAEIIYRILKAQGWRQQKVDEYGGLIGIVMHKDGQVLTILPDFYPNQAFIKSGGDLAQW